MRPSDRSPIIAARGVLDTPQTHAMRSCASLAHTHAAVVLSPNAAAASIAAALASLGAAPSS